MRRPKTRMSVLFGLGLLLSACTKPGSPNPPPGAGSTPDEQRHEGEMSTEKSRKEMQQRIEAIKRFSKGDKSAVPPELRDELEAIQQGLETDFKTRPGITNFEAFYGELFKPVEKEFGKLDKSSIVAIVGFPMGGPVNLSTVGKERSEKFITYVSCELAAYERQQESADGPFEVLVTSNDENWARTAITAAGQISFEAALDAGHSIDLGQKLEKGSRLQGVVFERFSTSKIGGKKFGILRAIGVTRAEMEWSQEHSVVALIKKFKAAGIYPHSDAKRTTIAL